MNRPVLSRYLDAAVLSQIAGRRIEPRGLVLGNLAGSHRSPLSGFAVEFAGHREYVRGDDPRHIDWRVYFRRDKYVIKQYEMETNLVAHLVVDTSASMRYGTGDEQKLRTAARLAATLAYAIVQQSDKVSLATCGATVTDFLPPAGSPTQLVRISELLDNHTEATGATGLAAGLVELAGRWGRREIVVVISDFLGDLTALEAALQRLRYPRHEVVLFQTLHYDELHFEFSRLTNFIGLEVDDQLLAQPQEIRRGYLQALERHNTQLADLCQRNRVERVLVDTRRDLASVLVDYLNQRTVLAGRK